MATNVAAKNNVMSFNRHVVFVKTKIILIIIII